MAHFRKIKAGLVKSEITNYVGERGNIFFDVETGELRLSDGVTPFGLPILGGGGTGGGHVIQDEGLSLIQRAVLNFTGDGVVASDAGGKTIVTINTGGVVAALIADGTIINLSEADVNILIAAVTDDLETKVDDHIGDIANPHQVTAAQTGAELAGVAAAGDAQHLLDYDHDAIGSGDNHVISVTPPVDQSVIWLDISWI